MGLTEHHIKQQEETDRKILEFMKDLSIFDRKLVDFREKTPNEITGRYYWINGISRGTNLDKETVRKSVERLIEKGLIWERPKSKNTRVFQICFKDWKKYYNHSKKYGRGISIKIPREDDKIREIKKRRVGPKKKKQVKVKELSFEEMKEKFLRKDFKFMRNKKLG